MTVVEQLVQRKLGVAQLGQTKTRASRRTVDLSEETVNALRAWREAQDKNRRLWAELYEASDIVFCRENGCPHDPRTITRRFPKQAATAVFV